MMMVRKATSIYQRNAIKFLVFEFPKLVGEIHELRDDSGLLGAVARIWNYSQLGFRESFF
jgi:hypothetical protein